MSWQVFSWNEIQARTPRIPERLIPNTVWVSTRTYEFLAFVSVFLTPFALMEAALGLWRLGADLGWAGAFFINKGVLSHWQVWIALAAFSQSSAVYLNRLLARRPELSGKDTR